MGRRIGVIWDRDIRWAAEKPFEDEDLNQTYRKFSKIAEEKGAEIYITNFRLYDEGRVEKAFRYGPDRGWHVFRDVELDAVYDKYKFDRETVELKKELQQRIPVINRFELEEICKDKLLSYEKFPDFVPETRKATSENVEEVLFDNQKAVIKPRYDYGGHGVNVIESVEEFEPGEDLLVQAFVDSSNGLEQLGVDGVHDLRVLVINDEIVGSYLRIPEDEGLISNVSMGGRIELLEIEDIPEKVLEVVEKVKDDFSRFQPCFYSVDTILDQEGEVHILEFNSKPGLSFHGDEEIEDFKTPVIRKLVDELIGLCN